MTAEWAGSGRAVTRPAAGRVEAVGSNGTYAFSKPVRDQITLIAGMGVEGDAHAGPTVKHRSRVRADPTQPNLRQVHLMPAELFEEVRAAGFEVGPGQIGENITTSGVDLLGLPRGTILRFGRGGAAPVPAAGEAVAVMPAAGDAVAAVLAAAAEAQLSGETARAVAALVDAVERVDLDARPTVVVMGLRNPCAQIDGFRPGLLKRVLGRDEDGNVVRRAGVMGVVLHGGRVRPGDPIDIEIPPGPHQPLERI